MKPAEEISWHEHGADVPRWGVALFVVVNLIMLGMAVCLILTR